eukprot:CAMPEP_0196809674 /NCGR_PEP_ID=MMETSP1362-20130617/9584_1 /TAXON_ID=163516 /ORGANISM="Leptocylindrus danicus, Strain CCMP1856" /LENGTH=186 /DNA_ID=CAMNT_0042184431 /DNA_START=74 /DNA_END=634 /DNA_ORIENTATION=-
MKFQSTLILFTSAITTSQAFVPTSRGAAFSASHVLKANADDNAGEDVKWLVHEADICAHSESCSLEDAEVYYSKLSSVSNSGAVSLEAADAVFLSQVLADLKLKLDSSTVAIQDQVAMQKERALSGNAMLIGSPLLLLGLASIYASVMIAKSGGEVVPFELQEWKMAAEGGYLNTMIEHFLRNGGL